MANNNSAGPTEWTTRVPPWVLMLLAAGGFGTGVGNWAWNQNQHGGYERLITQVETLTRDHQHLAVEVDYLAKTKVDTQTRLDMLTNLRESDQQLRDHLKSLDTHLGRLDERIQILEGRRTMPQLDSPYGPR